MKLTLAILIVGIFLNAQELSVQACNEQEKSGNALKGSFLKKGKLEGEFCDNHPVTPETNAIKENKNLKDLKAFLNSSLESQKSNN
ncbi:hypothetical protein BKH41_02215 [Helicobacter sp. 12S02232-10]|uniref:hypothetical protein n=1 Tax=Helicobacter sp. 12S02232-10 TaxID=1476197 RepID=UPI000BA600F3|nr:hypothetical protein [Helicobacter sp. 12S02232-10]PAF49502.1 hypothetical protein BKH41_02215 [Helicobacter sp. 12S02232-10]